MVAQFKFTVLLMPNGPQRITGINFDPSCCQSEHSVSDEELKKLLTASTKKKANKKKKPVAKDATASSTVTIPCFSFRLLNTRSRTVDDKGVLGLRAQTLYVYNYLKNP